MPDLMVMMPLAQMNAPSGTAGTAPAVEAGPAAPAAPAAPVAGAGTGTNAAPGGSPTVVVPSNPSATNPAADKVAPPAGGGWLQFLPIILMLVALYFFMIRGQRKDEKRRKALISELKKNDRVMTIGGMVAKVVSIDGDEVVLKIDEAANVKATYRKSAIQEVISDDKK